MSVDVKPTDPISKRLYVCEICFRTFTDKNELENHHNSPPKVTVFECNICKKSFQRELSFMKHRKTHGKHQTDYSDIAIAEQCRLAGHEVEDFCYPCDDCFNRSKLTDSIYPCDVCNKSFVSELYLTSHLKRSHMSVYSCGVCGVNFTKHIHLVKHYDSHTKNKKLPIV